MSGICGWVNWTQEPGQARTALNAMLGGLHGDGFDAGASPVAAGYAVAARRGVVPVSTHVAGLLATAVRGDIRWRSSELAALSVERGHAAAATEAYRRHGLDFLKEISGPFALALVDGTRGDCVLAIDRIGIDTMCYANPSSHFVFGSTADSVAAHPAVEHRLSDQGIFNYLYSHVVPSPGTIYEGICKLQPGECVTFRNGAVDKQFYWHLRYNDPGAESLESLKRRFNEVVRNAVQRSIGARKDIGAFLSGGTDSSTVAGLLTELTGSTARTYSIGFSAKGFDEMEYARITSRHFATEAHEYYVTAHDVLEAIPMIAAAYDEPFGNASAVPTYFCAKMAKADGVNVMLAGDGGDEIFGGNVRYAKQKVFETYGYIPAAIRRALIEPLAAAAPRSGAIPVLSKLQSYVRQASIPLPDRLEAYNFLHRSPLEDVLEPEFLAAVNSNQPLELLREVYQRTDSTSPINRMMHLDLKHTLADNDLRKVSRMCEAAGVEVRYPLLDDALVEFSGDIPAALKVKGFRLRYFFKQALKDFLPPETLVKTKHGFGMPFGLWLTQHKPLADLAQDSLAAFSRRGIVKPGYVTQLFRQHETTHATYYGVMIWVIMTLEHWLGAKKL